MRTWPHRTGDLSSSTTCSSRLTAGTSFGPTDVAVLSRRMKVAVMIEAAVALVVVVLVVARAVNVLG